MRSARRAQNTTKYRHRNWLNLKESWKAYKKWQWTEIAGIGSNFEREALLLYWIYQSLVCSESTQCIVEAIL